MFLCKDGGIPHSNAPLRHLTVLDRNGVFTAEEVGAVSTMNSSMSKTAWMKTASLLTDILSPPL